MHTMPRGAIDSSSNAEQAMYPPVPNHLQQWTFKKLRSLSHEAQLDSVTPQGNACYHFHKWRLNKTCLLSEDTLLWNS